MQTNLSGDQIRAFHHPEFVEDQARHFIALVGRAGAGQAVTDVGGGCGFFAKRLTELTGRKVRVIDTDPASVDVCRAAGVDATRGDALDPGIVCGVDVVAFNLILHHLVGRSEAVTRDLQRRAIAAWCADARAVFVNEYIYESYIGNLSGRLIFQITKSRALSWIGRAVSAIVPSLRANTFGVGVRFRSREEWMRLFASAGYDVRASLAGAPERVAMPLRLLLLIKCIRRDSFLLHPRVTS